MAVVYPLRASPATTPEDVSHSQGRNIEGEGILRMEVAGTLEEDDSDSQDCNMAT